MEPPPRFSTLDITRPKPPEPSALCVSMTRSFCGSTSTNSRTRTASWSTHWDGSSSYALLSSAVGVAQSARTCVAIGFAMPPERPHTRG